MRRAFVPSALVVALLLLGCGDDDPDRPTYDWVLVDTDSLTGFYVGRSTGGLVTIRVDNFEVLQRPSPATPPLPYPTEVYGTLFPDDADTVLQLTGTMHRSYGTTYFEMQSPEYHASGGYRFVGTYSDQAWSFGGAFSSPSDTGYFGGYVGSIDSVQVYCGTFAGDSLHGHWHFAVRAPALKGAALASDTSAVFAFDGTVSGPGPSGSVVFAGSASGDLTLNGSGTLDSDHGSGSWALSGGFDAGTWTVDRLLADSTGALNQEVVDK